MYIYDDIDQRIVDERVAQYRDQTRRYLAGELTDDEFRPLRLQNGLYIQRHAPMLRVAIPYGLLSSLQLRKLAHIARVYDRGYAHFSTRQNIQFNWPELEKVPDILSELATVQMHAIQTSGSCVRNITTDQFAGVAPDEVVDARPLAEILRQWSTFHPEFAYLPRKFKIAVNGAASDRAVIQMHDIGLGFYLDEQGEVALQVWVGGGMGRTPVIGTPIRAHLPWQHALSYCEAILRVYNRYGRRDNAFKARIKILVKALGAEEFTRQVEEEWVHLKDGPTTITRDEMERVSSFFRGRAYETLEDNVPSFKQKLETERAFANWVKRNVHAHKVPGYRAVTLSLKPTGIAPGDATADQMDSVAFLADRYSFGELRVSHEQNLILADVKQTDLYELWQQAARIGFATPNIGLLTDIVCCPGGDFCSLANAKSIPIAQAIQGKFDNLDYLHDIGDLDLNISGCMNSCGHHHVGHIGVLGVDKDGSEWYQITIGGHQGQTRSGERAAIGKVIGPSFARHEIPDVVERLIDCYLRHRDSDAERFVETVHRIGLEPFKEHVYGNSHQEPARRARFLAAA